MKFYKETTDWQNKISNHIYLLDDSKSKLYAYIKVGTTSVFTFHTPIPFSSRGRSFKEVKNTFDYQVPSKQDKVEKFTVTGSKGDKYIVSRDGNMLQCSCTGFKYRGKCKHIDQVKHKLK
jgi:hypothetical protein